MLSDQQYEALCKYRGSTIPTQKTLDPMTAYLYERHFIVPQTFEYTVREECDVTYQKTVWVLTEQGNLALESFEEFTNKIRKEKADKEAANRADRKFQTKQTILNAIIGAILALLIEHFSDILSFLRNLLH